MKNTIKFFILSLFFCLKVACAEPLQNFLTLSDIHFDPFISCFNKKKHDCAIIKLLKAAPASQWPAILERHDKSKPQYRLDTGYRLFKSSLAEAKAEAEENNVKFVLVLGDFLGHQYKNKYKKYSGDNFSAGYRLFVNKTMKFIANELIKAFPQTDVFSVVGNNDSYRGDYTVRPNGQFFYDLSAIWSPLIKQQAQRSVFQATFNRNGYYALDLPGMSGLRLIVLNSVLYSTKAKGKKIKSAAKEQLQWLDRELQRTKDVGKKAIIAMHIPTGINVYATLRVRLFTVKELWKKKYTAAFEAELKKYASVVAGVFASHLHSDWFQILTFDNGQEVPVTGTPAVSPIYGNNPGFKIYQYDPVNRAIADYITFFYPINKMQSWLREYDFNRAYQAGCKRCSLLMGMQQIDKAGARINDYQRFYDLLGVRQSFVTDQKPYYWCAIYHSKPDKYKKCIIKFLLV